MANHHVIRLVLALIAGAMLSSCGHLWMTAYRFKGGYYDDVKTKPANN